MIDAERANLLTVPDVEAIIASFNAGTFQEAQLRALLAGYAAVVGIARRYELSLTAIAAYDDELASDRLVSWGSYSAFDEPCAVECARHALDL